MHFGVLGPAWLRSSVRLARAMHTAITKSLLASLVISTASLSSARGQGVLRATVSQLQPGGAQLLGGVGYFRMGSELGEFEVAVLYPFTESFTPTIYTPAGSLTFSLGSGEPRIYSGCRALEFSTFLPPPPPLPYECPAFMTGTHYTGSFQSSSDILAELLAGHGELRLLSGSGTLLSGTMDVVVVPEPSTIVLFIGGVALLAWRFRTTNREPNKPAAGNTGIASELTIERLCPSMPEPGRSATV